MVDTCGGPHPLTQFSSSARYFIYRGFVGGQMLSASCSTKLTSSATMAHALSIASMSATRQNHDLAFSTSNNQSSGTTTFLNAWHDISRVHFDQGRHQ